MEMVEERCLPSTTVAETKSWFTSKVTVSWDEWK
jgi:hypothetical protein